MLEYLEPFNYVQTILILVYNQTSSDSFKNKITNKLLNYKSYLKPLTVCKQISCGSFKNVTDKLCIYKSYIIYIKGIWH